MTLVFEDTEDKPSGRKARVVDNQVWAALEDSAKRGITKSITADTGVIEGLRKDLGSASVRAKYDVTTATALMESGLTRLRFAATAKPEANPEAKPEKAAK
jgi:hypothetical protein